MDSNFNFNHIISLVWPNECLKIQPWLENKNLVKSKLQKIKFSLLHYLTAVLIFQLVLGKKLQVVYLKNYVSFTRGRETLFSRNFIFTTLKAKFMPSIITFFAWVTKFKPKRKVQSIEVRTQVHWLINRAQLGLLVSAESCLFWTLLTISIHSAESKNHSNHRDFFQKGLVGGI